MTARTEGLSQAAVAVLGALLEARTGQQLASNRAWRIDTALKPLLRERGLHTLAELVAQLLDGSDAQVGDRIVDALVNQESSFFRDAAVFDMIPDALDSVAPGRRARIWSAGCATGQEPLSLAMLMAERAEAGGAPRPEIVATDVSEGALARARAGRFTQFEIQRGLSVRRMIRWFETAGDDWVAVPALLRDLSFRRLNLVADRPPAGRFDMVLCRNVLLYLAPAQRAAVFARLAEALRPGGLLLLGAGETVIGQTDAFQPSTRFRGFYEAVGAAQAAAAA
jgi:chemotaxis protein methyltransferase CheR